MVQECKDKLVGVSVIGRLAGASALNPYYAMVQDRKDTLVGNSNIQGYSGSLNPRPETHTVLRCRSARIPWSGTASSGGSAGAKESESPQVSQSCKFPVRVFLSEFVQAQISSVLCLMKPHLSARRVITPNCRSSCGVSLTCKACSRRCRWLTAISSMKAGQSIATGCETAKSKKQRQCR